MKVDVAIVGGGVAGLCCARHLQALGLECAVLEASDAVGGRVRTDAVDGFLLDRGFQVLLTAYPEAQAMLDYDALDLGSFYSGALVRCDGRFARIADPLRHPLDGIQSVFNGVGSPIDKMRVGLLRQRVLRGSWEDLFRQPLQSTAEGLRAEGFSPRMIERFFRPFLGGIFLEGALETPLAMAHFVLRMFSSGTAALPARGMGAIPAQLAAALPAEWIQLNQRAASVDATGVSLEDGGRVAARAVVVATEGPAAAELLGLERPRSRSVTCLYFSTEEDPVGEPILVLNGEGNGPINNLCVPSRVHSSYAPDGSALVSVTVLDSAGDDVEAAVRQQLGDWYGQSVDQWELIHRCDIAHALPVQEPYAPLDQPVHSAEGLYVCGDHRDTASLQGAMLSGRRVAQALAADWKLS